jgi:hypothetical protein
MWFCFCTMEAVESVVVKKEMYITDAEGCCIWILCAGIYSWSKEKEETQDEPVHNGVYLCSIG